MGATFVIVLREGFEAALLLGIVYAYLTRARPSAQEVVAYVIYLAGAPALFFSGLFRRGASRNGSVVEPAQTSGV